MPNTAYHLLEVPRGAPLWKIQAECNRSIERVAEYYGVAADDLPNEFKLAYAILSNRETVELYDSFLEWAEDREPVMFQNLDDIEEKARAFFFRLDPAGEGRVYVVHVGIPDPPPPGLSPSMQAAAAGPAPEATAPTTGRNQKYPGPPIPDYDDATLHRYGLRNGEIPPLALGSRVYTWEWFYNCRLKSVTRLGDGALHFVFSSPDEYGGATQEAFSSWLAGVAPPSAWKVGGYYILMKLRDTASGHGYYCSFYALHGDRLPILCTHGLLDAFPFWACWEGGWPEYQRAFPSRNVTGQPWIGEEQDRKRMPIPWPKALSPLLMKYLQQVFYWTRARASDYRLPLDELQRLSHNDVDFFVQECMGLPWKFRKKVGLPYNIKK